MLAPVISSPASSHGPGSGWFPEVKEVVLAQEPHLQYLLIVPILCGSEMPRHKVNVCSGGLGRIMSIGWKNVGLLLAFGIRLGVLSGEQPFLLTLRLGTAVTSRVNWGTALLPVCFFIVFRLCIFMAKFFYKDCLCWEKEIIILKCLSVSFGLISGWYITAWGSEK